MKKHWLMGVLALVAGLIFLELSSDHAAACNKNKKGSQVTKRGVKPGFGPRSVKPAVKPEMNVKPDATVKDGPCYDAGPGGALAYSSDGAMKDAKEPAYASAPGYLAGAKPAYVAGPGADLAYQAGANAPAVNYQNGPGNVLAYAYGLPVSYGTTGSPVSYGTTAGTLTYQSK